MKLAGVGILGSDKPAIIDTQGRRDLYEHLADISAESLSDQQLVGNCCRLCGTTDSLPRRVDPHNRERSFNLLAAAIMVDWELDPLSAVRLLFRTEAPGIAPAFGLVSTFGFDHRRTSLSAKMDRCAHFCAYPQNTFAP